MTNQHALPATDTAARMPVRPDRRILLRTLIIGSLTGFAATACGSDGATVLKTAGATKGAISGGSVVKAEVALAQPPAGSAAKGAEAVRAFTAALTSRLLTDKTGNLVCSPFSVALALGMTANGAVGATQQEMLNTLDFDSVEGLDAGLAAVVRLAESRAGKRTDATGTSYEIALDSANSLWPQRGSEFQKPFLDAVAKWFGAGLHTVDYKADAEAARTEINGWTSEQTHAKIPELIPHGVLSPATRLVLVNAVYFKAPWHVPFTPALTALGPFTGDKGDARQVPMMHNGFSAPYAHGSGWESVTLHFAGRELAMTLVRTEDPGVSAQRAWLTADKLRSALTATDQPAVQLTLPKWNFRTPSPLTAILPAMGMPLAFDADKADFSAMTTQERLYISAVIHEAFIAVDENGAEAAAATAVIMDAAGAPAEPKALTFDRPFLFVIHEVESATPLFIGRVAEPSA
ncbi:serpin family protein [Nostocoides vanveenii]|uniref:serpin family protein n=1 Tax=Nostocoides vanveenii TaxID=330835 RepID=UPI0031DA4788